MVRNSIIEKLNGNKKAVIIEYQYLRLSDCPKSDNGAL